MSGFGLIGQVEVAGNVEAPFVICASGSTNCGNGFSGLVAVDGSGQLLVGLQAKDDVVFPATLTSVSPAVTFMASPTYTAELQRLSPAPGGSHWAGYISPTLNHTAGSGPQTVSPRIVLSLRRGADGSPFRGTVQGGLTSLAFPLRYAGTTAPQADFSLAASSTLPGALFAVSPDSYLPPTDGSTQARVAIGVPAGARPGTYEVTPHRPSRQRPGALGDREAHRTAGSGRGWRAAGGAGTGTAVRLRLTTLPHRLSAKVARRKGVAVLIGATEEVTGRVRLLQGRAKEPKASKRVLLRVPGPTKVVLRSARLRKGPYRVVIRADGRTFVRRAVLAR